MNFYQNIKIWDQSYLRHLDFTQQSTLLILRFYYYNNTNKQHSTTTVKNNSEMEEGEKEHRCCRKDRGLERPHVFNSYNHSVGN